MKWQGKTCELCRYRVGEDCRHSPPPFMIHVTAGGEREGRDRSMYPPVSTAHTDALGDTHVWYQGACARYEGIGS